MSSYSAPAMVNVLLCGLGRIGTVHYKNLLSNARANLLYIYDVDQKRAQELAAAVPGGNCRAVATLEEALGDEKLNAVIVCTPTATHTNIVIAAAKAKKTIMCEVRVCVPLGIFSLSLLISCVPSRDPCLLSFVCVRCVCVCCVYCSCVRVFSAVSRLVRCASSRFSLVSQRRVLYSPDPLLSLSLSSSFVPFR
jgi:Oxidoreductase family, NAD-binding Rossmann fold